MKPTQFSFRVHIIPIMGDGNDLKDIYLFEEIFRNDKKKLLLKNKQRMGKILINGKKENAKKEDYS